MGTRGRRTRAGGRAVGAAVLAGLLATVLGGSGGTAATAVDRAAPTAQPPARVQAPPAGTWSCTDDLATSALPPVLLVPGAGLDAAENWNTSLAPYLTARGHAVCLVTLPSYGTRDVQDYVSLVTRAIKGIAADAGRDIDVIGHSLGAYLPRAALRLHPVLAGLVDDVVGLAGVYDAGSQRLVGRCSTSCVPALHQLATGSDLLRAVARRPLPTGPSYSNVGSTGDASVTPQPTANTQRGTTSVAVQDVCASRRLDNHDHALIVGDAVATALVVDALDNAGPVKPSRVPAQTCEQTWYDGFDPDAFMEIVDRTNTRTRNGQVSTEPRLDCWLRADCRDLGARGRLVRRIDWNFPRGVVELRATATTSGVVRMAVGPRTREIEVRAGQAFVLRVRRSSRATKVLVSTVPRYYTARVVELKRSLP